MRYTDGSTREVPLELLRLRDFDESNPWRRVGAVHGMAHYSGDYASATTGGYVVYESRRELARLLLADFDPSVCGIYAQPFRMVARVHGKVRSHVTERRLAGEREPEEARPAPMALLWSGQLTTDLAASPLSGECIPRRCG